ncbi:lamin tail domain-containing protein [bacterium]|nr:lamin tail domain-containing protein [bacterium]
MVGAVYGWSSGNSATADAAILYNATPWTVNLNGWRIVEDDKQLRYTFRSTDTIGAFGWYSFSDNVVYTADSTAIGTLNITGSGGNIAVVAGGDDTADLLGWGSSTKFEGSVGPTLVAGNSSLYRYPAELETGMIYGMMIDSNANSFDFVQQDPTSDVLPTRNSGSGRITFSCNAPADVTEGVDFGLSCTALIVRNDVVGDTVVTRYSGYMAWGDITASAGTLTYTGADSTFTSGVLNNYQIKVTGATGNVTIKMEDAYCTGFAVVNVAAVGDTIAFRNFSSGATVDTGTASILIEGTSSGDSQAGNNWDTVWITFDGVDTQLVRHTETGVWACTGNFTFPDNGGVRVVARLYRNGAQVDNETVTIIYDGTQPKITAIANTEVISGGTFNNNADSVVFYIVDTGAGFSSTSGCTLHFQQIGGSTINDTRQMFEENGSGTWTVTATIPFNLVTTTDTQWKFWLTCSDDAGNNSLASGLSPPYTANNNGTATINVIGDGDVVINEIMWGGRGGDGEYVELRNTTGNSVEMTDWTLVDGNGLVVTFTSSDSIPANGFFLVMNNGAINDTSSHFHRIVSTMSLVNTGETLTLKTATGVIVDSTPTGAWPAGENSTDGKAMDRAGTPGVGSASANWENAWDTYNTGGRTGGGTPGHRNPNAAPNVKVSPDSTAVAAGGKGQWTFTITNGPTAFSSGRIVLQIDSGGASSQSDNWTKPQNSDEAAAGYVTASVVNGTLGTLSTSGDSVILNVTSLDADNGVVTLIYGNTGGDRSAAARVRTTAGRAYFNVFFDENGTTVEPVNPETAPVHIQVSSLSGGSFTDTSPSANPQSFISSEYPISVKVRDAAANPVYGAHVWVTLPGNGGDSQLSEDGNFTGLYEPSGNGVTRVGGWTYTSGEFQFNFKTSATVGLNQINFDDTDASVVGPTTYSDSARLPVPVVSEVMWGGAGEYIEIYNPTHDTRSVAGWAIYGRSVPSANGARDIEIGTSTLNAIGYLNPFSYAVIADIADMAQDSGFAPANTGPLDPMTFNAGGEAIYLVDENGAQVDIADSVLASGWFAGSDIGGGDTSMERVYPNRTGALSSAWASSDSTLSTKDGGGGGGSPGRPNAKSLSAVTTKFFDRLDTDMGRDGGQTDATFDTVRVNFTLKIASGDTQPNQQIGVSALVEAGPANHPASSDSAMAVILTPTATTNSAGTTHIRVSSNSNNFSGTVTIRLRQPYGVRDSTHIVFDRGDSFGYVFQASETNIFDTSATNALLVYVRFSDTFSGLDTAIMPQYRWKIGTTGTYSNMANMTNFSGDTFLARIDISSSTWAVKPHDTIYWQVTWRDRAGNYDTSPDNNKLASEFIDNTRARDTVTSPTQSDTLSGSGAAISLKITDQANDYCTLVIKYDTYSSRIWAPVTLSSGSLTNIAATTGGATVSLGWNTVTDIGSDTTNPSVRLRIEVFDGFDTHTDTSGFFGVTNTSGNDPPQDTILLPTDGDTFSTNVTIRFQISDPDSNACTVAVQFSKNNGNTWQMATLSGTSVIGSLYAPTFMDTKIVVWLSKTDLPDTIIANVKIRVIPNDGTDTGIEDTTANFGLDNDKPSVVASLEATADVTAPDTGVYLSWSASSSSDSKGYNVYRSSGVDSASSTKRNNSLIEDTLAFKDSDVAQGDTYYYYVVAVDTYGNESDSSEQEAAPNLEVVKTLVDSGNLNGVRPGDTVVYRLTVRNNGFAPALNPVLYDYVPSNTIFHDSATETSLLSTWTIHYRVAGASSEDVWQTPRVDSATMVRFTRLHRFEPSKQTNGDTLTIKVKIQ